MSKTDQRNGEETTVDDRVYQKKGGQMYIDTNEFVESKEGQNLIDDFIRSEEEGTEETHQS